MKTTVATVLVLMAWAPAALAQGQMPGAAPAPTGAPAPGPSTPPPNQPTAGGLTAPGPVAHSEQQASSETEQSLEESKEEDSGRGMTWFWIEAEGGFQHVGLETFEVDTSTLSAGFVESTASGGFAGVAAGVQLLWFRLGPRGRIGFFDNYNMWSIGGELGIRFPLGPVEPYIQLGGGYTALGGLGGGFSVLPEKVSIDGFHLRFGGGLDIFLGKVFYLGASATWELMGLTRPGVSISDLDASSAGSLDEAQQKALAAEGSGYGSAVSIGGKLGIAL